MTQLGTYPSRRYSYSWITQRLLNRAPEWSHARQSITSIAQQVLNPSARRIEETLQQLNRERYNMFLSTADMNMLSLLYYIELPVSMNFTTIENAPGDIKYVPPNVYATIDNAEYQIMIAEENNIRTLWDEALPTRIEYGEEFADYNTVVTTTVGNLSSITPNDPCIEGHLYIMLSDNSTWEIRTHDKIYYSKIAITGTTQKGTEVTEVIPLRRNDTFKTIYRWKEITEVRASYLSDSATLIIGSFFFDRTARDNEHLFDERNIVVPREGGERRRFVHLGTQSWGSTLVSESYTVSEADDELIRKGIDSIEVEYEIELLNAAGSNITLADMTLRPNTNYAYAIDATRLYVYDYNVPYPDVSGLMGESVDSYIDLYSDRWFYARDSIATIKSFIMDATSPPHSYRWTLTKPSGAQYYVDTDGSLLATTITDSWNDNLDWENSYWNDITQTVLLDECGTYILMLEYRQYNEATHEFTTFNTRFLMFVAAIRPETTLTLPIELRNSTRIGWDSDGYLWFFKNDRVYKSNIYHDYFLADYATRKIWFRENYSSVRIAV